MTMRALFFVLLGLCACGGDADVAGDYTIAVTNTDNGCMFMNFTVGDTMSSVPLVITQSESALTANVGGGAGIAFNLVFGSTTMTGEVDGEDITLRIFGTPSATEGMCTWTANATVAAGIDGDFLSGTLVYRLATNGSPDCGFRATCTTTQTFNGTRPP
jgi:hypothetical protein